MSQTINFGATRGDQTAIGGSGAGSEAAAQSFVPNSNWGSANASLLVMKNGSPTANFIVGIQADSSGVPSNTDLGSISLPASSFGTSYPGSPVALGSFNVSLTSGATYWLVLHSPQADINNDYLLGLTTNGSMYRNNSSYPGTWSLLNGDQLTGSLTLDVASTTALPLKPSKSLLGVGA